MPTEAEFRACSDRVRNWGRWGAEDQIGTLNFITAPKVSAAASLVQSGKIFPLGTNLAADGVWSGRSFRRNPVHLMVMDGGDDGGFLQYADELGAAGASIKAAMWGNGLFRFNDDFIMTPLQAASHWDALAHVYYEALMYNGVPAAAVTSAGAARNSIEKVDVKGITSRAVLLDIARSRSIDHIPRNERILPAELDAVARTQGASIESGDIVLIRTGWWEQLAFYPDEVQWRSGSPGLDWTCADWLHDHEIAAVAADNIALEASGYQYAADDVACPLHLLCLRDMGLMFGELWNLKELAADCAIDGRYDMQLVAPPLRVVGGIGSPVNPLALK